MVMFYHPPELPYFHRAGRPRSDSVVERHDEASGSTTPEVTEVKAK